MTAPVVGKRLLMATENDSDPMLITTFAHDLRVPLRSIVMTTQRIQRRPEELTVETRAKLDEIIAAARRQEELISSVVEFDQSFHPGLRSDNPLALRLAIQTASMKVDAFRQAHSGTISFDSEAVPRVLVRSGIARVVEKVLHNSLKFHAPNRRPEVSIEVAEQPPGLMAMRIIDNGLGVEAAYREDVFKPFKRLNSASEYPGSGLGLSICRRLLESIDGTIQIEGSPGAIVLLRFPKMQANAA